MKRLACVLLALVVLAGCARQESELAPVEPDAPVYAIVVKDANNPYMRVMFEGFADACAELGAVALLAGPGAQGDTLQEEALAHLLEQGVSAIVITANDGTAVSDALRTVVDQGIPVVSLDSVVNPGDRMVHIQQAQPETVGRVLIQASARILEEGGTFAILSTTDATPNRASWVRWMLLELEEKEAYSGMQLAEIAYGLDEYNTSLREARRLLREHPDLKLIIAPTVVGMRAAADAIVESQSGVLLTGLGLPSEMEEYILLGVCPWMYLWNPAELGYLAAYAADALVRGTMHGTMGEILSAGRLGDKIVTESEDGGTEIVLGNPIMFDMSNVSIWSELF